MLPDVARRHEGISVEIESTSRNFKYPATSQGKLKPGDLAEHTNARTHERTNTRAHEHTNTRTHCMSERTQVTAGVGGQVCLKAFVWERRTHATRDFAWIGWYAHGTARQSGDKTDTPPVGASHSSPSFSCRGSIATTAVPLHRVGKLGAETHKEYGPI